MSNRNDPGNMPAFPTPASPGIYSAIPGMSLREHYAGLAMQGACANGYHPTNTKALAQEAVRRADALLAALFGRNDGGEDMVREEGSGS